MMPASLRPTPAAGSTRTTAHPLDAVRRGQGGGGPRKLVRPPTARPPAARMTANVLILTPVKSAAAHLPAYLAGLDRLTYPRGHLALGLLEGDSTDDTHAALDA